MEQNIFDFVKKQVNARELVKSILGEPPVKNGETWKWHSPFRDGDSDPSLCVNEVSITDFGGDFKGDIFKFVVSMGKAINNFEALKYIAKEFNIELPTNYNTQITNITQNNNITYNKTFELKATDNKPEEIYCMFDTTAFAKKPTGEEIGIIKNNITNLQPMAYQLKDIKEKLITGHTCIPAGIKSQTDWKDNINFYQVFMVDVDNVKTVNGVKQNITADNEEHITVDKIISYCKEINLLPTFVYYTFSHTEQQHKFRLVYILEMAIQSQEIVKAIYNGFKETFKDYNIDTAPTSIATMFFGGTSIAYESNTFYKITETTKEASNDVPAVEIIDNYELQQCMKALEGTNYFIYNGHLYYAKSEDKYVQLSNFVTYPIEKINYINGRDTETFYKIKCLILDEPNIKLAEQVITVEQLQKNNYILGSSWDKYAITSAGSTIPDKLREASQHIGRHIMEEKNIYAHTGFTRINGKLCYLYHGGVIGNVEDVFADLSMDKLERFCFTNKEFDTKQALQCSLSMVYMASYDITIPLLATIYTAPLTSMFSELGIHPDFILFIQGKTGTRKSSIAALSLCHFGIFDRDTFPASFRDTLNSIEKIAFLIKDSIIVVDDYNPEIIGSRKLDTMERLYAMYGDRVGRTRMSQNGKTLKLSYVARGMCIVTGETVPDVAQSRIARSLILNIEQNSIDLNKLTDLQNNSEELAFSMKKYIEWIIKNEQDIKKSAKEKFNELKEKQNKNAHGRTNEIANVLTVGFTLFTQFLLNNNVIDNLKKEELDKSCYKTLVKLVENQTQEIADLKPTEMFYNALDQLFATNSISVLNYRTGELVKELSESGSNVGYYDDDEELYYFFPNVIYNAIIKLYASGNVKFPINAKSLWKYLLEENKLYRTDKRRYTIQRKVNGQSKTVVAIKPREDTTFANDEKPVVWNKPKRPNIYNSNTF